MCNDNAVPDFVQFYPHYLREAGYYCTNNAKKVSVPPYHPYRPEMEHDWAQYYDKVQLMDSLMGALIDELAAEGLAENTLVFYYSDQGGVLGRSKRFMSETQRSYAYPLLRPPNLIIQYLMQS